MKHLNLNHLRRAAAIAPAFLLMQINAAAKNLVSFRLHGSQLYMTMPKSLLGRDMLMASCVRSTTHYKYAEVGTRPQVYLVQWQRDGDRVALKQLSTAVTGNDTDKKESEALKNNFEDYYIASVPLTDETDDSLTLNVSRLYGSGTIFTPFSRWFRKATVTFNKDLSAIRSAKAFDDNFSVTTQTSYTVNPVRDNDVVANNNLTATLVISALLLPKEKMRPRLADSRYGFFTESMQQYDRRVSDLYGKVDYIDRWNIRPKDYTAWKNGKLVEPTRHIVFYIDNKFPEAWKAPIRKGILLWNPVFRSFGIKDPIVVKDYPVNDPDFDEDNLKYSCIRYIPTDRGGAQGPSWADPRTGETFSADVYVWGSLTDFVLKTDFAQTAQVNKAIRSGRLPERDLADHLTCTISHEIGHILGLAHNMAGSNAYSIRQLLDPQFMKKNGLSASTMDYIYFNYIVPPGREDVPLWYKNLGPYDKLVLKYIYYPTDEKLSVTDDYKVVSKFLDEKEGDARYRYGEQQWGTFWDPTVVNYDLSNEPLKATEMGINNLKYVVAHFNEWLKGDEKDALRKSLYAEIVNQFKIRTKSLLWYTGGIYANKVRQGSGIPPYKAMARQLQQAAFRQVADELLTCQWLDKDMAANLEDPLVPASVDCAKESGKEIVKLFKKVEREEMVAQAAGAEGYTRQDLVNDILAAYFPSSAKKPSLVLKTLQNAIRTTLQDKDYSADPYAQRLYQKIGKID